MPDKIQGFADIVSAQLPLIAGAAATALFEWGGWRVMLRRLAIGGLTAYYLAPLYVPTLISSAEGVFGKTGNLDYPIAFLSGVAGAYVFEVFIFAFRRRIGHKRSGS